MAKFKIIMTIDVKDDIFEEEFTPEHFVEIHETDSVKELYRELMKLEPSELLDLQAEHVEE